jgi:hypothetical protein
MNIIQAAPLGSAFVTIGAPGALTGGRQLLGTSDQIVVTDNGAGVSVTLSLPQSIHTGATPTFAGLTLSPGSGNILVVDTSTLVVDATNHRVGIGTVTPTSPLHVYTTTANPAIALDGDGATSQIWITNYGTSKVPAFIGREASGTFASPTATASGAILLRFGGRGYGTSFNAANKAGVDFVASELFSATAQGAEIRLYTTPIGGTTVVEAMRLTDKGNLQLGTAIGSTENRLLELRKAYTVNSGLTRMAYAQFTGVGAGTVNDRYSGFSVVGSDAANVVSVAVSNATNATPIVLTTATHGFATGDTIAVYDVGGNTAANGLWLITVLSSTSFSLNSSVGNGAYTSGGTATNRSVLYGFSSTISPSVARGGMTGSGGLGSIVNGDDANCYSAFNGGIAKGTDAFYLGRNTGIAGSEWANGFAFGANLDTGIFFSGTIVYALFDFATATLTSGVALKFGEGHNATFGTTTGTKFGTATTQKLGFYNATPIVQPSSTTDLRTALINLGLYATGGASPLDLNGGALTAGGAVSFAAAASLLVPASAGYAPTADGSLGYDTTRDAWSAGGAGAINGKLPRVLSAQLGSSDTITASVVSTAETNFATNFSVPGNFFIANKGLRVTVVFSCVTTASPTVKIRLKLGTTAVYLSTALAPASSLSFGNTFIIQGTAAAGASVNVETGIVSSSPIISNANIWNQTAQPVAVATNGALTLQFSAEWSANTAGNSITLRQLLVEELN